MYKYENSGMFVNTHVNYPFNITNVNGTFIENFWEEINNIINEINDESLSKIRYIWIDAANYCQTEIFLKNLLIPKHEQYPILYLHWIDFVSEDKSVYHQLSQQKISGKYFINNSDLVKICVVDHAEMIDQIDQYFELCKKLQDNKSIFIFVSKNDNPTLSYWDTIVKKASRELICSDCLLGIIRSEKNHFVVKPYSHSQCKEIFNTSIQNRDIKNNVILIADTLEEELRRPYYLDFLIKELNGYESVSQMPSQLDDANLILKIFNKSLGGIITHLNGFMTLHKYLDGYYDSSFVRTFHYGEHSRIPFDNYAWAYGIMYCSNDGKYADVIKAQFNYFNDNQNMDFTSQLIEINERIVQLFYSEKKAVINNNFVLKDYFLQMINYNIVASKICASVLNKCYEKIETETCEIMFKALGKQYNKLLTSNEYICEHYLLGIEIGFLMKKVSSKCICEGLGFIYKSVCDNYVEPQCNNNGISVIPITNFEFEKFVRDNGYCYFYSLKTDQPLYKIATDYYKEIFDFIISALSGHNPKASNCLARLLRGYAWDHYKKIAYLFSRKDDIDSTEIYKAIGVNYPDEISHPAKWKDNVNSDIIRPFCNPLQPVVCVNIFEARAYAKWLSQKINKPVRVLIYDPDYLSVIGEAEGSELRRSFISHIEKQRGFINSVENDEIFYGKNDIKIKAPFPVAMPNLKYLGIYDFVGNIFEMQDTPFTYNYVKNNSTLTRESKENEEVFIDYNCPGGGLQRTEANWPPEYMGQVPAFLRNQDIGFRVVIGSSDVGLQKHKLRSLEYIKYSESVISTFVCNINGCASIFDHIHLDFVKSNNKFDNEFIRSKVWASDNKNAVIYTHKGSNCKESILLIQNNDNIFAYHLISVAITNKCTNDDKILLKMIVRRPIIPKDLVTRKKIQNCSCSEWINIVELIDNTTSSTYLAYPINIQNGSFRITNRKVSFDVRNGRELKRRSTIQNEYKIHFNPSSQSFKHTYYESFKAKLGVNLFLPDWIDIVDFINTICINMSTSNRLDIDTVMAAISTIDTADLHEQINKEKGVKWQ